MRNILNYFKILSEQGTMNWSNCRRLINRLSIILQKYLINPCVITYIYKYMYTFMDKTMTIQICIITCIFTA